MIGGTNHRCQIVNIYKNIGTRQKKFNGEMGIRVVSMLMSSFFASIRFNLILTLNMSPDDNFVLISLLFSLFF